MTPNGWTERQLDQIVIKNQLGGNFENSEQNVGLPLIKMGNIGRGSINLDKVLKIPEDVDPSAYEHFLLKADDLLFNTRNTLDLVGKVALYRGEFEKALYDLNLMRLEFDKNEVESTAFMNYWFNSSNTIKKLRSLAIGTTSVAAIYNSDLFKLKVKLPPKPEQEKIAKILSTWDQAVEKLDRLIEKSEKRLKALGQKLLFNGLKKYLLHELCTPKQWKTISSKELLNEGIPVFGANSWIGFYSEANHQEDCIAITCRGATCGTVNYVKGPSYITGNSMALDSLKTDLIDRDFLYFYLRTLGLNSIISGSAQPQITGAAIGKVEIVLPSLPEQIKASSILVNASKEVDGFKKIKEKIVLQKQGLMQQLLTGKKRVKV